MHVRTFLTHNMASSSADWEDGSMVTSRLSATVTAEDADWLAAHLRRMVATHPAAWATVGLTLPQLTALHIICAEEPLTLAVLAQALGTGSPATCAMVDRLARAGLVHRAPDPRDQRRIQLTVTSAVKPMIGEIDSDTAKRVQAVLHSMSPAARRCLTAVLWETAQRLSG
jgi:DNA-binding MarR family transcriptional regulator